MQNLMKYALFVENPLIISDIWTKYVMRLHYFGICSIPAHFVAGGYREYGRLFCVSINFLNYIYTYDIIETI